MSRELGRIPSRGEVVASSKRNLNNGWKDDACVMNPEILEKMGQIEAWMTSEKFLLKRTPRIPPV